MSSRWSLLALAAALVLPGCCCSSRRDGAACLAADASPRPPMEVASAPAAPAPAPMPVPAPKPEPKPAPPKDDLYRAPQLGEGTFTIWFVVSPSEETLVAVASRSPDGTEVWIMNPSWVTPNASNPSVTLRVQYEAPQTFIAAQPLLNWAGTKPAIRPAFHGLNLKAYLHDTLFPWDGAVPRYCVP